MRNLLLSILTKIRTTLFEIGRILLRISRILNVRILVHYSWYAAFALLTMLLVTQFPDTYNLSRRVMYGVIGTMVLFTAVGVRQILLDVLALSLGIPVRNTILFVFGGLSTVPRKGTRPGFESLLAMAGLIFNLMIGGAFYWSYLHLNYPDNPLVTTLVEWLVFTWVMIIALHLIPGYPLDGGKLVSAILWGTTRHYGRSLRLMVRTGRIAGWVIAAAGIWLMLTSERWITGALPTFLGWALQAAARDGGRRAEILLELQPVQARQIMTEEFPVIPPQVNISQMVRRYVMVTGQRFFIIAEEGKLLGTLTLRRIKRLPKRRWGRTEASKVMTPARRVRTVDGNDSVAVILEQMEQSGINEMPVLAENKLIGTVTRDSLVRLARTRIELRK